MLVPGEHVIDPWSSPLAYAQQAMAHGAIIHPQGGGDGGRDRRARTGIWQAGGAVSARVSSSMRRDSSAIVSRPSSRPSPFTIKPRKGQFVVFDKPAAQLVRAIILPVPTERTKGVVLFRTIFGNLAIGPTAEEYRRARSRKL